MEDLLKEADKGRGLARGLKGLRPGKRLGREKVLKEAWNGNVRKEACKGRGLKRGLEGKRSWKRLGMEDVLNRGL